MKHAYRADIDGLRAIAVLSVLFFHLESVDSHFFKGGYLGVDVFFVISGFLITRILHEEIAAGVFSYANFYERRARRIIPSAFATLALSVLGGLLFFSPNDLKDFAHSLLATLSFVSNLYFWQTAGYFTSDANVRPLLHMWSLSIEEQFYIIWPMLLAYLIRKTDRGTIFTTIGIISFLSIYSAVSYNKVDPNGTFYLLPFRIFEFLIGSACVWLVLHPLKHRAFNEALTLLGIALIVIAMTRAIDATPYPSFYSLVPCIGAALVIYAGERSRVRWLLANRLAVAIGLISYELYLMHWPVYIYYQYRLMHLLTSKDKLIVILLSFVLAFAVYIAVGKPLRHVKDKAHLKRFIAGTVAAMLALTAVAFSMQGGWSWRIEPRFRVLLNDSHANREMQFGGADYFTSDNTFTLGDPKVAPSFIFFGDSFAMQYSSALDSLLKENHKSAMAIFHVGCLITPNAASINGTQDKNICDAMYTKMLGLFAANSRLPVVDAQSWAAYANLIVDKDTNEKIVFATNEPYYDFITGQIDKIRQTLGPQRKFVVIGLPPSTANHQSFLHCFTMPTFIPANCSESVVLPANEVTPGVKLNPTVAEWAKKYSNVTFINPRDVLCDEQFCHAANGTQLYYSDYVHLSNAGAALVINHFRDVFLGL